MLTPQYSNIGLCQFGPGDLTTHPAFPLRRETAPEGRWCDCSTVARLFDRRGTEDPVGPANPFDVRVRYRPARVDSRGVRSISL